MRLPTARALTVLAMLATGRAEAQESTPAPARTNAPAACFPACREGYTCYQNQCVSLCNPPCPAGLECVEGRRCQAPATQAPADPPVRRAYEPPPPAIKGFELRSFTLLGFHLGFPGKLKVDEGDQDLATTLGFNVRGDAPIGKYVLLGPMLQLGSWRPDTTPASSYNYAIDLDLVLRFRAPITTSDLNYQLWLGMPVGLTLDVMGDPPPDTEVGLGWNIGVLFGGAIHLSPKFGLFGEVGWQQHRITHRRENFADLDFKLQQALLNLGIVVRN
jgi:hypothetical protein